ncbi:MAG: ABC transporter permease [Candidatus Marsarchaeota archaeon]|nr:ABC transporter permease [Candidatus Marsarchaeota archaeon]
MKTKDTIWLALKGISQRKLRTGLTILSVVIGVAAIVALVSLVAGISASISSSLSSIGPTSLYILPKTGIFTVATIASIESLPNVSVVVPMIRLNANATVDGQQISTTIIGVNNYSISNVLGTVNLYNGNVYNQTSTDVGIFGHGIAFPSTLQTSPSITLDEPIYLTEKGISSTKSVAIVPVGVLNSYGSSILIDPDTSIFVPLQIAQAIENRDSYNLILVKATNASSVGALDTLLTNVYGSSATIFSVQKIAQTVSSITGSLGILLGSIAGISLIVAGISILSIMMVSVNERTHEIGILKSIGFKKRDILILFLSEALIIGIAGGVIGVVAGTGGSYILPVLLSSASTSSSGAHAGSGFGGPTIRGGGNFRSSGGSTAFSGGTQGSGSTTSSSISLTPIVTPTIVVIAIAIAIIVSIAASLYPAWKASTVDPIKALRSE